MKFQFLILVSLIFSSDSVQSQNKSFAFGLEGGMNLNSLSLCDEYSIISEFQSSSHLSPELGYFAKLKIHYRPLTSWIFGIGVGLEERNFTSYQRRDIIVKVTEVESYNTMLFVMFPVSLMYTFGKNNLGGFVGINYNLGYNFKHTAKESYTNTYLGGGSSVTESTITDLEGFRMPLYDHGIGIELGISYLISHNIISFLSLEKSSSFIRMSSVYGEFWYNTTRLDLGFKYYFSLNKSDSNN